MSHCRVLTNSRFTIRSMSPMDRAIGGISGFLSLEATAVLLLCYDTRRAHCNGSVLIWVV